MLKEEARERLARDIERIVQNSARCGSIVRTSFHAGMLADTYAEAGFSIGHIIDAVAAVAIRRGVPVELGRPEKRD